MSGKPATPAASRAGVPGAQRVLVYVADPRHIDPGAAAPDSLLAPAPSSASDTIYISDHLHHLPLPKNTIYKTQVEHNDTKSLPNTIFYQSVSDETGKVALIGDPDKLNQQSDIFSHSPQHFLKEPLKIDDNSVNNKRDCINSLSPGALHTRLLIETGDITTYQTQCLGVADIDNTMPSLQPAFQRHGQIRENKCNLDTKNSSDNELSVDKNYVNYQFLERSVSHQSIVNQSISILNQQVGVSRGHISETDGGNVPQILRTSDGVMLAVLPSPVLSQSTEGLEYCSKTVASDFPQTITVPLGWRRIISGTSVLYLSPSGTALGSLPQLREYLQTAGTCKCGLPCPLRPEVAFSFDSKVVSKPYQPASGAELTRLCNHKRKLLATLQARSLSPSTPPPHQADQKKVGEVALLKTKMKKRTGYPPNMSVSQLMVHRERPLTEFKPQDHGQNRAASPLIRTQPLDIHTASLTPMTSMQPNVQNVAQDVDVKHETYVQKGSHYLTVNSGWITQHQENLDACQKNQNTTGQIHPVNTQVNVCVPVLGTNGQLIGVNTAYNKQANNSKSLIGGPSHRNEQREEKKRVILSDQNIIRKQPAKEETSQIFCGLNQALTPEVMQKINEQQHLFIQQNQKQIELAMKGYRTQLPDNMTPSLTQSQSQFTSQGQLVIQNGTVVKTNPAKTPPWQVKRNDSGPILMSPTPKHRVENVPEEGNANISEESSSSNSSYSNEYAMNQSMCSRVPPLPQHYNVLGHQWPVAEVNKKKMKNNKGTKKKSSIMESKVTTYGSHSSRINQDSKEKHFNEIPNNHVPSFMDDPNGYLAQQTVLLNNTISRQVGVNSKYEINQYENSSSDFNLQNPIDKSCKLTAKNSDIVNMYKNNMVPNLSPSPNNMPDSSVLNDKSMDQLNSQCCKGCNDLKENESDFTDNLIRMRYMKHSLYKMELDGSLVAPSPRQLDDNPVTSSTFLERNTLVNDSCNPIQAGTVSTSNNSPVETLQPPEPSPTPSNSSRSTDTPHSNGSNNSQQFSNSTFSLPSPAHSNAGSFRENLSSNPSTPGSNIYAHNSPGLPGNQLTGNQMMHFISNHNVNKNLMDVDNISMVGMKPNLKSAQDMYKLEARKIVDHTIPGYCPPPHLGGGPAHSLIQACYIQTFVTTMASGFSVTRDTVTSVLAGKANTATTSINTSQANFIRPPPPSVNLPTSYAIPNNQPDPFINSVNLPTSYPLHIAGTTAQNMITKSPLEMVQNVIGTLPSKTDSNNTQIPSLSSHRRACLPTTPSKILISSTGQIIVSNNQMPPPPPKISSALSQVQASHVTNVTTSVTQVIPAVGGVQPLVNNSPVVVNTLPAPYVIQPSMMTVDNQVVQQNSVLPQIVPGNLISGQNPNDNSRQMDVKSGQNYMQGVAMISPESLKKRNKKKKNQTPNITNVLHITAPQQNPNNIMVHHSSPQHSTSPQFSPRGFQLSPNSNISSAPMLQALTIVPGKSGTPAHIVMNGQGNTNNFGSQQIITNTSPSQPINLLQPVNLINNSNNVMPNFQTFQQFIVPNLGGMVMTADGTTIIQDSTTGMPVQLHLQTVNGQNVLTPVQNSGVFSTGHNGGVVIRAQNQQGKIIQSQTSPGAQFLSPNSQVMMNSPNFNGQLSPLLANLSPTNVTFNAAPTVRPAPVQSQEFVQTNQIGQTLMVPLSPKQLLSSSSRNSTLVQNTTIVQQQTTLVSNNTPSSNLGNASRLSIDPNMLLKQDLKSMKDDKTEHVDENAEYKFVDEFGTLGMGSVRHSVSTQTLVNQQRVKSPVGRVGATGSGGSSAGVAGSTAGVACSPPDTTTHSPLGALESAAASPAPRLYSARCLSSQANLADTTTKSPEPDINSSGMVQCVSSSEQDMAESRERAWCAPRNDFQPDPERHNMMANISQMRNRSQSSLESSELSYNHNVSGSSMNNQHNLLTTPNYYERAAACKRKNEFGDTSFFRTEKMMRTNYSMVHAQQKDSEYDKIQARHFQQSGTSHDPSVMQKVLDRNLGSGNDVKSEDDTANEKSIRKFEVGDLVWGPVKGYNSWPGKLEGRAECGRWTVRWFGADKGLGAVDDGRLLTLTEGLEAHHAARTKHRKSRKLNTLLENAIQEAMSELDKKCDPTAASLHKAADASSDDSLDLDSGTEQKRNKKHVKVKKLRHHKKSAMKLAQNKKVVDNTRLRSSR